MGLLDGERCRHHRRRVGHRRRDRPPHARGGRARRDRRRRHRGCRRRRGRGRRRRRSPPTSPTPTPCTAAITAAADALGGISVLFNNAGIGAARPLHEYSDRAWAKIVGVNLAGTFHGIRAAVPLMREAGGCIVNHASVSGVRPTRFEGPYSAAKAGVISLTMDAALEYAPAIRVNCVSPGFIDTALTAGVLADPNLRAAVEDGHAARAGRERGRRRQRRRVPRVAARGVRDRPQPRGRRRVVPAELAGRRDPAPVRHVGADGDADLRAARSRERADARRRWTRPGVGRDDARRGRRHGARGGRRRDHAARRRARCTAGARPSTVIGEAFGGRLPAGVRIGTKVMLGDPEGPAADAHRARR